VRDPHLFHEPDYWQHPTTFEQLKRGDCEDHALWAWRKLAEQGIDARFVVGRWRQHDSADPGLHAWVFYEQDGASYVMETVTKDDAAMVQELGTVRDMYSPHFSVDRWYRSQAYEGYLHDLCREVGLAPTAHEH
jgi:hypothetical protein